MEIRCDGGSVICEGGTSTEIPTYMHSCRVEQ